MIKQIIFKYLKNLLNSFIAGLIFGVFAIAFVFVENDWMSYLIPGLGLLLTLLYGYDSFMAKMPYVVENKGIYVLEVFLAFIGNLLGVFLIGSISKITGLIDSFASSSDMFNNLINYYNDISDIRVFVFAIFTGFLVYFGVNTYKKAEQPIARFLVLLLCCALGVAFGNCFISYFPAFWAISGFDKILTGKFYIMLLGNMIGLVAVPLLRLLRSKL